MIVINDLYYLHDDTSSCKFKNNVKFTSYMRSQFTSQTPICRHCKLSATFKMNMTIISHGF